MKHLLLTSIAAVSLCLLATSCHSSHQQAHVVQIAEYDRPGLRGVESSVCKKLVDEARRWVGTKYVYGGDSRKGIDCSGLVSQVYLKVTGIKLPRDSRSQQAFTKFLPQSDITPGDLVFFSSKSGGDRVSHVGIYIGHGEFIHASTSRGVIVSRLDEKYYVTHYHSAGRVPGIGRVSEKKKPEHLNAPHRNEFPSRPKPPATKSITVDSIVEEKEPVDSIEAMVRNAF